MPDDSLISPTVQLGVQISWADSAQPDAFIYQIQSQSLVVIYLVKDNL